MNTTHPDFRGQNDIALRLYATDTKCLIPTDGLGVILLGSLPQAVHVLGGAADERKMVMAIS
jgi:hypothetical protein